MTLGTPIALLRRPLVGWAAVYVALTIVVTFPLVTRLSSTVAHDLGDPLMSVSLLWWNAHVLPLTERWWNGFAFFPAPGMIAFSDHRLGESLIASPLQWLGCSPVTAYNLTLLATFPLCALAGHALGFVLTRRHDAAAVCGLAYGFNPYRMAHLSHLELLAAFGMPVALAALHRALATRQRRWMVAFAAALVLQGLCTSYYIAFFAVLLALWIAWFVKWRDRWLILPLAGALLCLAVALWPLAREYARIHAFYGMSRTVEEVMMYSADVTSLVTANSALALWGWTSGLNFGEAQIFPGLIIAMLVLAGAALSLRHRQVPRDRGSSAAAVLCAVAAAYLVVAVATTFTGPWSLTIGPLKISADVFYKPFSVAIAALVFAAAASRRGRDAWARRSVPGFYLVATVAMFLCSFGPAPTFLGRQVLYKPPYAWLMQLPVFSTEIRVPARFAMLGVLTLSAGGAVAFDQLAGRHRARSLVAALLMIGIVAEGWLRELPLPALPEPLATERAAGFDAIVELPLGDLGADMTAMYRATFHDQTIVNGASGYLPAAYVTMASAASEGDPTVVGALAEFGRLLVAVDDRADADHFWRTALRENTDATAFAQEKDWSFFALPLKPSPRLCEAPPVPLAGIADDRGPIDARPLVDRDPRTFWWGPVQQPGERLTIDLGKPVEACGLVISLGKFALAFPRRLAVSISEDGSEWTTSFDGSTAALAVHGALARPTDARLELALVPERSIEAPPTRFIRLQLERSQPLVPWLMSDISVLGRER